LNLPLCFSSLPGNYRLLREIGRESKDMTKFDDFNTVRARFSRKQPRSRIFGPANDISAPAEMISAPAEMISALAEINSALAEMISAPAETAARSPSTAVQSGE